MSQQHTNGPWKVGQSYGAVIAPYNGIEEMSKEAFDAYGGYLICESANPNNARLIAAAPELLEALKKMQEVTRLFDDWAEGNPPDGFFKIWNDAERSATKAIAKATGQENEA